MIGHQSSPIQISLLKSSKMHISMKGQNWKNNIVVVEGRGENVKNDVRNSDGEEGIYRWFKVT